MDALSEGHGGMATSGCDAGELEPEEHKSNGLMANGIKVSHQVRDIDVRVTWA